MVGLAVCQISDIAHAQANSGPAEPGRIEERFKPPPSPESTPDKIQIPPSETTTPEGALQTHLRLEGVEIEGATVTSQVELAPLYAPMINKDVTLADIYRLRDRISAKYRAAGYILSQAIVPPQDITNGIVRIRVIEGSIAKATVEGEASEDPLVQAIADRIKISRPLRAEDLEKAGLLVNDIPGITARTILKPSETPGQADLVVSTERKPFEASLFADNRGSRAIGPVEFGGSFRLNNILGDDAVSLLYASTLPTRELSYFSGQYARVLTPSGLNFDFSISTSRSHAGGALSTLAPFGNGTIARVGLGQPLVRTRSKTVRLDLSFTVQNTRSDLVGTTFSRDRVRYLTAGFSYDAADTVLGYEKPASNLIRLEFSQGLNVLHALPTGTPDLSRANGHSDFTLLYGELIRVQRLGGPLSLAVSESGQIGFVPLLVSQQFGLGGKRYGRGYEPSELTGDSGLAFSAEPRLDLPTLGGAAQLYAFYDVGRVWDRQPLPGAPKSQSLASAGFGVRATIAQHVSVDLELAKPLTRDIASRGNRDWRPFFDVSLHY